MDAYCENGECRVVLFRVGDETVNRKKHFLRKDPVGVQNCPGCGQFGRLKDDPKDKL